MAAETGRGPGQLPRSYGEFNRHVDLSPHLRYVERNARKLARSTFYAMSRWQGRMETKQGFLGRIVDIGAELFAMSAACVRAEHLRLTGQHGREAYQLADAFCRQSRIRVDELFGRLWSNTDDLDRKVVKGVLAGTYEWLEQGVIDPSGMALDRRRDARPEPEGKRPPPHSLTFSPESTPVPVRHSAACRTEYVRQQ